MSRYNVTPLPGLACVCNLTINTPIYINNAAVVAVHVPLAIFAVVSNAVIILTVIKTPSLRRPANILQCSLALSDFLVGAIIQPLIVARHLMQNVGANCCLYNRVAAAYFYATPIITCCSFVQVCVMCWDRYKAVSSPLDYRSTVTNKKTLVIAVTSWVAWFTCLNIFKFLPSIFKRIFLCLGLASFIIICAVAQIATLKVMRRNNNQIAAVVPTINTFAREKKIAVTVRWILAAIVLSAFPQLVYGVATTVSGARSLGTTLFSPWAKMALCLSSSLNPVIYFWRHDAMRNAVLRLIRC